MYTDADGYQFVLYMPKYLNYNGYNGEMLLTHGAGDDYQMLAIRPERLTGFKYYVLFGKKNEAVETDFSGNLSSGYSESNQNIEKHQEDVAVLLEKAKVFWPSLK